MEEISQLYLQAKLFKGFGDSSRLSILEALMAESQTVTQLVKKTGLTQSNVSMHLACLLDCGLVQNRKEGRYSFYEITGQEILAMIATAKKIVSQHAEQIYQCTRT